MVKNMFVKQNKNNWHNGQQTQPKTICAAPARTIKGNEDTLPS
jgi:hypothetical protein